MHRLLILSDLHLEQSAWDFPDAYPPHDIAIFAGDVSTPLSRSLQVLAEARDNGPLAGSQVVLVPGNHEFYHADMLGELESGKSLAKDLGIYLLDCSEVHFGDLRVVGATLWTDYALYGNPGLAMATASRSMNDHALIRYGHRTFKPDDALAIHERDLAWLRKTLARPHDGSTVVVTHHCPSRSSVHPRYGDSPMNAAFSSDLDATVMETQPTLWLHGHTHDSFDYEIGRTRVICNPKGYGPRGRSGIENAAGFKPDLVVEVA